MRTRSFPSRLAALLTCIALGSAVAQPKVAPSYHAEPDVVAQLPTYCWNQYVDGSLGGYKFSIPSESCGVAMNHFCPALVGLLRAQKMSLHKNKRLEAINMAVRGIDYTIRDMKPGCFITKDVLTAKERAITLSKIIK